ncbi:hypothetical protein [Lysinibacillus sp. G4S2]|uniref:hypothetical protein n=1 Tax=Lysinibacillus sp. G4S2 TaxID=3055859 RepID=UPI0025A1B831|nr:hypothetical protein [Lysinibacillus sp. G4S2]MDM5250075.1 hypothetical protein [Lysinibacillus sp. G4S2]
MKKIILSLSFTFMFAILSAQGANASEDFETKVNELSDKYDFELVDLENSYMDNNSFLEFNDLEEFEEFLIQAKENDSISTSEEIKIEGNIRISLFATEYKDSHQVSWWGPMNGPVMGVLNMRNMSFDYTYKFVNNNPQFVNVTNINSWQTGYHDVKWTHRDGTSSFSKKYSTKDTANVVAKGLYTLGVVIGSNPIGFSWNGEWNRSLTLIK